MIGTFYGGLFERSFQISRVPPEPMDFALEGHREAGTEAECPKLSRWGSAHRAKPSPLSLRRNLPAESRRMRRPKRLRCPKNKKLQKRRLAGGPWGLWVGWFFWGWLECWDSLVAWQVKVKQEPKQSALVLGLATEINGLKLNEMLRKVKPPEADAAKGKGDKAQAAQATGEFINHQSTCFETTSWAWVRLRWFLWRWR